MAVRSFSLAMVEMPRAGSGTEAKPEGRAASFAFLVAISAGLGGKDSADLEALAAEGEGDLEQDERKAMKVWAQALAFCQPETVAEVAWGSGDAHVQSKRHASIGPAGS
jgi:hypothetical protein